jgi:hypothetical protein
VIIMTKFRFRLRRIARAAAPVVTLVAVSALVVACGSAKPRQTVSPTVTSPRQSQTTRSTPPTQTTPPAQSTPTGTPSCATSDLQVRLERDQGGGAMGTQYHLIEFTNVSGHGCQLRGYPGVSAYGAGHQLGSAASWDGPIAVSTVTLQPGATAHSTLGIRNAGNYPADVCEQVTAAR